MKKPIVLSLIVLCLATILSGCYYHAHDDWWGHGYRDGREYRGGREYRDGRGYYEGRRGYDGQRYDYRGYR